MGAAKKSWREMHKRWVEDHMKGDGWIVMGLIGLFGVVVYGFGIFPIPALVVWLCK